MHPWDGRIPCHPIDGAGVVFVEVPKAGCTSVKLALATLKGGPPEPDEDIHHWYSYTWAADVDELYRWFDTRWRHYFRFTVVRDPIARFESYYYSLVGERGINSHVHSLRTTRLDIHAVPQAQLIGPEPERFDLVGRTEDMAAVQLALAIATGRIISIPHANRSEPARRPITAKARARLDKIYRADFALLAALDVARGA